MGFTECFVNANGADDGSVIFLDGDEKAYGSWLDATKQEAIAENVTLEVWTMYHDHTLGDEIGQVEHPEECSCVQYLTDHKPNYVFTPEG